MTSPFEGDDYQGSSTEDRQNNFELVWIAELLFFHSVEMSLISSHIINHFKFGRRCVLYISKTVEFSVMMMKISGLQPAFKMSFLNNETSESSPGKFNEDQD